MNTLKTPILLTIFNRIETTEKVFEAIKKVKPEKLYIAADGPRPNVETDILQCEETRKITESVDWPCQIFTLFKDGNLGVNYACTTALDWFFEHEEEGIILEDDCVPNADFFTFCANLLEKYRHDPRIMHIGGSNLQFGNQRGNASYYFSSIPTVWGWASWRRVWENYDPDMPKFEKFEQENQTINLFPEKRIADWVNVKMRDVYEKKIIAWDYPLVFHIAINNGLCIVPNVNLVTNIGFNHPYKNNENNLQALANIPTQNIKVPLIHPKFFIPHKHADFFQLSLVIDGKKTTEINQMKKSSKVNLYQKIKNKILEIIK